HQAAGVALLDSHFEGIEEDIAQRPFAYRCRPHIRSGFRLAVARHVLERGDHSPGSDLSFTTLEPAHRCQTHPRHEVRIFAIGLLDPTPAWVADHVHHR